MDIVQCIFKSCDQKNTNCVPVSCLIEFIKPYMPNNPAELDELQKQLDPDSINPNVDYVFFQKVMDDWIANIQGDGVDNGFSEFPTNFNQFLNPNATQIFCESHFNNNNKTSEMTLEDQVHKLQHQLAKTTAELDLVKQQLTICEDQNESLLDDINTLQKSHQEQLASEQLVMTISSIEEEKEKTYVINKKYEQLEKMLSYYKKQLQTHLVQVNQLDNENQHLKNKLRTLEKINQEGRKTINDMKDCLDIKESEISTLVEVTDVIKSQLDEKTELVTFYVNERKLLKQRIRDLECLLQEDSCLNDKAILNGNAHNANFKHVFNTPKLLNQLANPVSPSLSGPLPNLKQLDLNSSSTESSSCSGSELFSNFGVIAILRSPHKSLKEELADISSEKIHEVDEVKRLYELLKDQEGIKNSLWQNLKQVSNDNESLRDYKDECGGLMIKLQEKDEIIDTLQRELHSMKKKQKESGSGNEFKSVLVDDELINLEEQKEEQLNCVPLEENVTAELRKEINSNFDTDKNAEKDQVIYGLTNELKTAKASLHHEKLLNANLLKKLNEINPIDKSTQTDNNIWANIPSFVSETVELRKSNFSKQQIRLERLLEKQERVERELAREKSINTKLTLKYEEAELIRDITTDKCLVSKNLESSEMEVMNLRGQCFGLEEEIKNLRIKNQILVENLRDTLNKLKTEHVVTTNLRIENEVRMSKQRQLEMKLKENFFQQANFKKYLADLKAENDITVAGLYDELTESKFEIRNLRKQMEISDTNLFLLRINEELESIIFSVTVNVFDCFKFSSAVDEDLLRQVDELVHLKHTFFCLENEMIILNKKINLFTSFCTTVVYKYLHLLSSSVLTENRSNDESHLELHDILMKEINDNSNEYHETAARDDDSFKTCDSETCTIQDVVEATSMGFDSFLDNLELGDVHLRQLSFKEMEEKFVTLASLLAVDVSTSANRYILKKERFTKLTVQYYEYLNCSIESLRKCSRFGKYETAITHMQLLKDISKEVLKTAVEHGVTQCEKRSGSFCKLVINYVAILSQENKKLKQTICDCQKLETKNLAPFSVNRSDESHFKSRGLILIFIFFLGLVVSLIFYIDQMCPKNSKRMCPIQWIMNLFIEETYSDNFPL
ncbi:putative leucine-rich repeat-containing protein DDB_G0290503 isoform X5 [Tenebrio molitor]|uniref:putative leucine-rich repeat-containing protein DDB_G0290503 isoform X5 n=1 Tax=Tenebrio molitor TaxID=7067 RepID=UPI003624A62D